MDKVVMITGGSSGIGKRMVEDFAGAGYKVVFSYLSKEDKAKEVADSLKSKGYDIAYKKVDILNEKDLEDFVSFAIKMFGKIDVLINNAAITNDSLFRDKTSRSFERVLKGNLVGAFILSKLVGKIMYKNKGGKIINISSTNGINTYYPMCLEYDASKAGINSLTHNLAMQFAPYIQVNAIAPGFIGTESELEGMDEEFIKSEEEKIFLRRFGKEEDVSNLALFLASEKADYINNQIIKINGGVYGD